MNILFLGGAKRVSMGRKCIAAGATMGMDVGIFSYEMDAEVPIACIGEVVIGKRWSDPDVVSDILRVCEEHDMSIVIPFVDGAVGIAAQVAEASEGRVFAPVGDFEQSLKMFDKVVANEIFTNVGLPVPETYSPDMEWRPLIAKPRFGSASKGIVLVDVPEDLPANMEDYLVQERIDRRREYTVDCYVGMRDGRVKAAVPRIRLQVAGGEVMTTEVIHNAEIDALARRTLAATGLRGAVTVQLIEDLDTGRLMIMEINPRLGGGAVASVQVGADLPRMILEEAQGRDAEPCKEWRNATVARWLDETVFFH